MMTVELVAHNSTRNTASSMACGQAAGTAAGLSLRQNVLPRKLDVALLRKQLLADGALLEMLADPI
jgi:hypothetical protein